MASTVTQQMNISFLGNFTAKLKAGQKSTIRNIASSMTLNLRDSFSASSADSVIRRTVQKMQAAINVSISDVIGRDRYLDLSASRSINQLQIVDLRSQQLTSQPAYQPSQAEIAAGVQAAGGREALNPWLVDGWTKLDINGSKVNVNLLGDQTASPPTATGDQKALLSSIGRFGLDASHLEGGADQLRTTLKQNAAQFSQGNPNLSSAFEFALEDAFAQIAAWENPGVSLDFSQQTAKNMNQAKQVADQLGLGSGGAWGIESLAQDLAVFGMDLTAINTNPQELIETIRSKSMELLGALDKSHVGTEGDIETKRRQITGASARLVNGLQSSGSFVSASMQVSSSVSSSTVGVRVDGVNVNASALVAVGNVIVDPLVFDLNGDGIDLKSAEDGVDFDMNGDGSKTTMGFIQGDDALLFIDEYGDGVVRDGRQLFGNADGYANGFEKLRAYDDNGDGVIDENDAIWDSLRLWVEKTEDGVCDKEETMSLSEAGIKSIKVGYQDVREDDGKGNLIGQVGSFERTDGTSGLAADVWLQELRRQSSY